MLRFSALALTAAALAAAPAAAQDAPATDTGVTRADGYVGVVGGYHDLGDNDFGDDGGAIFGGVAGFDVPVGGRGLVIGVEGNFEKGTGAIEYEYGAAARIGYKFPSGGVAYVRGGYQWVNIDLGKAADLGIKEEDFPKGTPDVAKDYLVGVGGEFPLGDRLGFGGGQARLRIGVDTVSFDSIRPTAGIIFKF